MNISTVFSRPVVLCCAGLFAAACEIAGVVAEQGEDVEAALRDYGKYLGIAFQLADDALGV